MKNHKNNNNNNNSNNSNNSNNNNNSNNSNNSNNNIASNTKWKKKLKNRRRIFSLRMTKYLFSHQFLMTVCKILKINLELIVTATVSMEIAIRFHKDIINHQDSSLFLKNSAEIKNKNKILLVTII